MKKKWESGQKGSSRSKNTRKTLKNAQKRPFLALFYHFLANFSAHFFWPKMGFCPLFLGKMQNFSKRSCHLPTFFGLLPTFIFKIWPRFWTTFQDNFQVDGHQSDPRYPNLRVTQTPNFGIRATSEGA